MKINEDVKNYGYSFADGICLCLGKLFIIGFIAIQLLNIVYKLVMPVDSSDKSWWNRSEMSIYTDAATGIQYLGHGNSLTVRLNSDGTPMKETK